MKYNLSVADDELYIYNVNMIQLLPRKLLHPSFIYIYISFFGRFISLQTLTKSKKKYILALSKFAKEVKIMQKHRPQ